MTAVFLNILVGVDDSESSQRALSYAVRLAESANAKLTLVTVAPPVSNLITLTGISSELLSEQVDRWAARILKAARESLPPDVIAHTIAGYGHPGEELVRELRRGDYDLVVLGSRGRGRAQEGLLGSVNGYVHFHAEVPLLSVP
jgi:nucleotide-binding universal stress UspA family protein